ncbi:DUF86 domain-containing protein [Candidatus Xianfuyuplasma coldseepsis]|uniref:DUF86 domain-containing protein n=1 Tax=Candidatus Xianfuyuplasma coldseepsis TaxID=2782163 RepID=A0A7L7KPL5_9MOLU|nr:HepT-like ribonuclease domain-containing protein [Xianfuyuplasma coldseepsis]QMS84379.1 DUF86 domain-containing protein [Xianfuyuplasma coldseepsis]
MNDRDQKTLRKIMTHIKRIRMYLKDLDSLDDFENDDKTKDAIVFNLLQIGELSNHKLTNTFKKSYTAIPWQKIYGLRNRIVHDYDNIHSSWVYQIIKEDLIDLYDEITILQNE